MKNSPQSTLVLGINSVYHESAAALVKNGKVICAVEEERFSRLKHGKTAQVSNPDELPWEAIRYCLNGIDPQTLDAVAFSFEPGKRLDMIEIDPYLVSSSKGFGTEWGEILLNQLILGIPKVLSKQMGIPGLEQRVHFVPHHLSHAASAFYAAPFPQAAILVVDGIGENSTGWMGRGTRGGLKMMNEIPYPCSIGFLWERIASFLGFTEYDAAKVMGLAAYGDPTRFAFEMDRLFWLLPNEVQNGKPPFLIDSVLAGFRREDMEGLEALFGSRRREDQDPQTPQFADLAATLQVRTEEVLLKLAWNLHDMTGEHSLVYAGGVALNCVANARLEKEGPFENLYVYGAAHDAGTAIGAALEVSLILDNTENKEGDDPSTTPLSPFLGPEFDETEIDDALRNTLLSFEILDDPALRAAQLLAKGEIVGWFQGRLEFGPRALGNRSLLADPRHINTKFLLNKRVKHREVFRPFAASVLEEEASNWFEFPEVRVGAYFSRDLMVLAYPVREDLAEKIPAVVHQDRSCRIQVVNKNRHSLFHQLISYFFDLTGVPLVLNTSFNDQEPLVATPEHAIATFQRTRIDALFLHNRLVLRPPQQEP